MKDSGFNWGGYYTPRAEALAKAAKQEFDPEAQNALLGKLHEVVVEDAMWIFVVHDLNPRALAPNVTGFVQAQSWLQDLTPVVVA
jgi:ABC-type transport system substrate-binding protein